MDVFEVDASTVKPRGRRLHFMSVHMDGNDSHLKLGGNRQKVSKVRFLRLGGLRGCPAKNARNGCLARGPDLTPCLLPAGKAEEKAGGGFQLPWRDVCSETPGQPGALGDISRGRGGWGIGSEKGAPRPQAGDSTSP